MDVLERIARGNKLLKDAQIIIHEDIEELIRLAKLGQRMQWVSVADRWPEKEQRVDIHTKAEGRIARVTFDGLNFVAGCNLYAGVTHWMPIPPNPGEGE